MACERPVLLAMEGEAVRLLERAQAGIAVPPEQPQALAKAILELQGDPAARLAYGRRGREFVKAEFSRQALAQQLERLLRTVV
jgi:glycosyltransferase involved in cell wall biosynthesis